MKTVMKNGLIAMAFVFAFFSNASAMEVPVNVKVAGEKSVYVFLGQISGQVSISIKDEDGLVLYSRNVRNKEAYSVQYDLRNLPDGIYVLELKEAGETKKVSLLMFGEKVSVTN